MSQIKPKKFQANCHDIIKLCDEYDLHPYIRPDQHELGIQFIAKTEDDQLYQRCYLFAPAYNSTQKLLKPKSIDKFSWTGPIINGFLPELHPIEYDGKFYAYSPIGYTVNGWTITRAKYPYFYTTMFAYFKDWKAYHPDYGYVHSYHNCLDMNEHCEHYTYKNRIHDSESEYNYATRKYNLIVARNEEAIINFVKNMDILCGVSSYDF